MKRLAEQHKAEPNPAQFEWFYAVTTLGGGIDWCGKSALKCAELLTPGKFFGRARNQADAIRDALKHFEGQR